MNFDDHVTYSASTAKSVSTCTTSFPPYGDYVNIQDIVDAEDVREPLHDIMMCNKELTLEMLGRIKEVYFSLFGGAVPEKSCGPVSKPSEETIYDLARFTRDTLSTAGDILRTMQGRL